MKRMLIHTDNRPVRFRRNRASRSEEGPLTFMSGRQSLLSEVMWGGLVILLGLMAFSASRSSMSHLVVGLLYVLCVVISSRLSFPYAVYLTAGICSALTISGLVNVDVHRDGWGEVTDRMLVLFAIWVGAFLSILWDKPDGNGYGTRINQRRESRSSTLHAEVITREPMMMSVKPSQENVDDLTQLNQELLQKNYELETLINVVSHDLRSPLVNIQGFSKELSDSCNRLRMVVKEESGGHTVFPDMERVLDDEIPEALRYIRAGADKINTVLSGILRFSRLGRLSLKIEQLNVNAIVSNIATVMEYELKEKGVLLQIDDLPSCAGDEVLVSQVFSNLIENANKYLSSERPGCIGVSGTVKGNSAIYAIKDNGIGIRHDYQGKIFEMFHRLDPNGGEGEGLGLTIVRRIVERHQGDVWVDSVLNVGTTFFVKLPRVDMMLRRDAVESTTNDSHRGR